MMLPRFRRDAPPRTVADLELPLAAALALAVGLLLAVMLNGLGGGSDRDAVRPAVERPAPTGVQAELDAGAQRRAEVARAHALSRARARRAARRRAAAAAASAAFARRPETDGSAYGQSGQNGQYGQDNGLSQSGTPKSQEPTSAPKPAPQAQPKPKGSGGGGGGFDDSG
jgi:hypothetical protein